MSWQSAAEAVERTVTGMGYDLVDIERSAGGLLRVSIDRLPERAYAQPGEFVTVDDCELLTRQLQQVLEVLGTDYARLEVSSPGLDRPLKKPADWQRFVGADVQVTLRQPFQGRKHWKGVLAARDDGGWRLEMPPPAPPKGKPGAARKVAPPVAADTVQALDFDLDEVREARLVPHVDFKGRRPDAGGPRADGQAPVGERRPAEPAPQAEVTKEER